MKLVIERPGAAGSGDLDDDRVAKFPVAYIADDDLTAGVDGSDPLPSGCFVRF